MNIFITAPLPKETEFLAEIPAANRETETQEISHGRARWCHYNEGINQEV